MQILNVPPGLIEHRTDKKGHPFARVKCHYEEPRPDNHNGYGFFRVPESAVKTKRTRSGATMTYLELDDDRKYAFHYTSHNSPRIRQCTASEVTETFNRSRNPQQHRDQVADRRAAEAAAQTGITAPETVVPDNDIADEFGDFVF